MFEPNIHVDLGTARLLELLWLGGQTFCIALALTPLIRDIFSFFNLLDHPSGRKMHARPVPRAGGIPIAIAYGLSLLSATQWPPDAESMAWKLLPGALIIFCVGLVDDLFSIKPEMKLAGQVVAALVTFAAGLRVETIGNYSLPMWAAVPITVFWLLLTTNALNLIDGLDGLCAGMGLFSTLTLFGVALLYGNYALAMTTLPLAAALAGFLVYNFNPATVFLGDSGALLIGYLLGCFGMIWTHKMATLLSIAVPLVSLSVPLLDLLLSVIRRFLSGQPIFGADRLHIHHRLLDHGLTTRGAVITLYLFAAVAAGTAVLLSAPHSDGYGPWLLGAFLVAASLLVSRLRYVEFHTVSEFIFGDGLRHVFASRLHLSKWAAELRAAASEDEWWSAIVRCGRSVGWVRVSWVRLQAGRVDTMTHEAVGWTFRIELANAEAIVIEGPCTSKSQVSLELIAQELTSSWRYDWVATAPEPSASDAAAPAVTAKQLTVCS
ncbi:MAG: MraY family glycosyltransferase [Acidobacteria bacterium]|nr:MraY family glycosyltransferase [Acidobacteriota bacterium]